MTPTLFDICRNNHGGNAESEAANARTAKSRDCARIVAVLTEMGEATCDELEVALDMRHQTCSARVSDLKREGLVIDTGRRRKTRTGCSAAVLRMRGEA